MIEKNLEGTNTTISNPEHDEISKKVTEPKFYDKDKSINPTLAKAVVVGSDGNIYLVGQTADTSDKQNNDASDKQKDNATIIDPKTLKEIGTTFIEIKTINGVNYFEFEGDKYHADPPR